MQNFKDIETLTQEVMKKRNGEDEKEFKIGIIVAGEEGELPFMLAKRVQKGVLALAQDCEIVSIPALNERTREFSGGNEVLSAYKKIVENFLEMTNFEKHFDGVVFIPSGFNCTVGCLVSSIRLNLPTLVLPIGLSHKVEGENLLEVLSMAGKVASRQNSVFDAKQKLQNFCETSGFGVEFSSEVIFDEVIEIMELSQPNSAMTLADSFSKQEEATQVAQKIVELTKSRLPLKKMINKKSILNASTMNGALGGSFAVTNALLEMVNEAEIDFDDQKLLSVLEKTPVLFDTSLGVQKFVENGGTQGLVKAMIKNKMVDGNYKTFSGETIAERVKDTKNFENFLVPTRQQSVIVFGGNLADKYGVTKSIFVGEDKTKVFSNVQVFESDEEASNAVLANTLNKGETIVIKPNYAHTDGIDFVVAKTPLALASTGKANDHIIISTGLFDDSIKATGITVRATKDSTLELLQNGDEIEIDFVRGKLNADVQSRELTKRQKKYVAPHKDLPKYFKSLR